MTDSTPFVFFAQGFLVCWFVASLGAYRRYNKVGDQEAVGLVLAQTLIVPTLVGTGWLLPEFVGELTGRQSMILLLLCGIIAILARREKNRQLSFWLLMVPLPLFGWAFASLAKL